MTVPHETPQSRQNVEEIGENPPCRRRHAALKPRKLKPRKAAKLDVAAYQARRLAQRGADDERLIETMRLKPEASIWELGRRARQVSHSDR